MATIGNVPEAYTTATIGERIRGYESPRPYWWYWDYGDNSIQREYHQSNVDVEDLKRRVRLLENELATTKERCATLEHIIMRLDGEFHEMKDAIWFRFIDIK